MSNHHLPDCQECGNEAASSFGPDGSMLCAICRTAAETLEATEAGDPTVWIMQGDNGEQVNITASMMVPPPYVPPATWVVTPDGEVSRNPAAAPTLVVEVGEKGPAWLPTLLDTLLAEAINRPLDMSVFYGNVPERRVTGAGDVVDGEVLTARTWLPDDDLILTPGGECHYAEVPDVDLPGMWSRSDFMGGQEVARGPAEPAEVEDVVNHPSHYTSHPSGVECITITEHMGFNLGNAMKYIWRCDLKLDAIKDLKKARFYVDREIAKRERQLAAHDNQG